MVKHPKASRPRKIAALADVSIGTVQDGESSGLRRRGKDLEGV